MIKNIGYLDKVIRFIIGLGLLSLLFILDGTAKYLGLIGLIPILTAGLSFCPLYALFGIKTCPIKK
ncbi:MAG: YgaP family membrane protein [Mobilitalea sp.]